jgi:hypothetical protein
MPRTIQATVDPAMTRELLDSLREADGVLNLRLQPGISVEPPGDVITLDVLDRSLHPIVALLHERCIESDASASVTTSEPLSLVSSPHAVAVANDTSEATWEEMDRLMAKDSNTTLNTLLVMAVSGSLAVIGISQDALHLVIGAMLVAPGFEPIVRGVLRVVARADRPLLGWRQLFGSYAVLLLAAALTSLLVSGLGQDPSGGTASYLPAGVLIRYWTAVSPLTLLVAAIAGAAGAVLVASNRSVLTSGVMVALALVPGVAITAIGLTTLDFSLAAQGALRWLLDVVLVAAASAVVFVVKRAVVHHGRNMT